MNFSTSISENELTILDIAAFFSLPRSAYFHDGFVETFNQESHGLTDDDVLKKIVKLENEGMLKRTMQDASDENADVRITKAGGCLLYTSPSPRD